MGLGRTAGLLEEAPTVSGSDSLAPGPIPVSTTTNDPESSRTVILSGKSIVGGSFTAATVSVQLILVELPSLSVTVRVITALPLWFGAGVTFRVRGLPPPLNIKFEFGMRAGLP